MQGQFRFAFIVMSRGFAGGKDGGVMESESCYCKLVGVSTIEEACAAAKKLTESGEVDRIELCGAFKAEGAKAVSQAIGEKYPVSYIVPLE